MSPNKRAELERRKKFDELVKEVEVLKHKLMVSKDQTQRGRFLLMEWQRAFPYKSLSPFGSMHGRINHATAFYLTDNTLSERRPELLNTPADPRYQRQRTIDD